MRNLTFRMTSESIEEDDDARILTVNGYNVTVIRRGTNGVEVQVWRDMTGDDAPIDVLFIKDGKSFNKEPKR